jgi:lysophospholipase L1-like esterase
MDPSPRFAAWPRWKKGLFAAIPLMLVFAAGEVTGRLLERYAGYMPRRTASYAESNPYLRAALVPNMRFVSGPFHVDVNSYGFRGPEIAVPKPAGTYRIFAVGESTTFGWKGVTSHDGAWPARLERKLQAAHLGRRIEVINAGVPGYTSIEQRINFILRISKLQPDAILIYHGNNDINWSWVPDVETKIVYGRAESIGSSSWVSRLIDYSYVAMEIRSRLDLLGRQSQRKHQDVDPAAIRMLRENLRGLIDDARRAGVAVAIGTFAHALDETGQPGRFSETEIKLGVPQVGRWFENIDAQGARRTFPVYNDMIRELARSEQIPLVDIRARIPQTTEFHTDWCHFTARGEERMAELWFETVQNAAWLEGDPSSRRQAADEAARTR